MTEDLWREILARIGEGVLLLDAKGEIVFANEAGRPFLEVVRQALPGMEEEGEREITVPHAPETRRLSVRVSRLGAHRLFLLRDVTAQRALEKPERT